MNDISALINGFPFSSNTAGADLLEPLDPTIHAVRSPTTRPLLYGMENKGNSSSSSNSSSKSNSSSSSSNNNEEKDKKDKAVEDRDIYNRESRLRYWLERAKEYEEVYQFARYMLREEKASLWVIRCITILLSIREFLGKPFGEASREDIEHYIEYCNNRKDYSPSTHKKIRQVLKYFFKVMYGNNEYYPEQIAWL
ncbi:MAG: phage integrase N-terminal SAM-like domain-containing protein, partial [Candidatus Nitrosocaldus sp.]